MKYQICVRGMKNLNFHRRSTGLVLPASWSDISTESRAVPGNKSGKWENYHRFISGSIKDSSPWLTPERCPNTSFKPLIDQNLLSNIYLFKQTQKTSKARVDRA